MAISEASSLESTHLDIENNFNFESLNTRRKRRRRRRRRKLLEGECIEKTAIRNQSDAEKQLCRKKVNRESGKNDAYQNGGCVESLNLARKYLKFSLI